MLILLFSVISFVLGGLGRRAAGGLLNQVAAAAGWIRSDGRVFGDFPARAIFGLTVAIGAWLGGMAWWQGLAFVATTFLGCAVGNFEGLGMGRGSDPYWRSFGAMELHGLGGTVLSAFVAGALGYWHWGLLLVAGLLCAPSYESGYQAVESGRRLPIGFREGPEVGEFIWGGVMALAALFCALGGAHGATAIQTLFGAAASFSVTIFHTLVG